MDIDSGKQVEEKVVAGLLGKFADEMKAGMNSYIVALFKFYEELLPLVQVVSPMAVDLTALACHPTNTTFRRPSLCSEVSLDNAPMITLSTSHSR